MSIRNYDISIQTAYDRARELFARAHTVEQIAAVYKLVIDLGLTAAGEEPEALDLLDRVSRKQQEIHARTFRTRGRAGGSFFPQRIKTGIPRNRAASVKRDPERTARKRRLAAMSILPPSVSESFTEGERAALSIISEDCREKGYCDASAKEIADRAGVRITTVRNAYRQAKIRGLIEIEERSAEGRCGKHRPNIYRIKCLIWKKWITSPVRSSRKSVKIGPTLENNNNIQYDFLGKMHSRPMESVPKRRFG
ncbi:hypothetical protein ABE527_18295 [Brucella sp. TWI432]